MVMELCEFTEECQDMHENIGVRQSPRWQRDEGVERKRESGDTSNACSKYERRESGKRLEVVLANVGTSYISKERGLESMVHLIYAIIALAIIVGWGWGRTFHGDHQAIYMEIKEESSSKKSFRGRYIFHGVQTRHIPGCYSGRKSHRNYPISDESMRFYYAQRRLLPSKKPKYWWKNEIQSLRAACFCAKRPYQSLR